MRVTDCWIGTTMTDDEVRFALLLALVCLTFGAVMYVVSLAFV